MVEDHEKGEGNGGDLIYYYFATYVPNQLSVAYIHSKDKSSPASPPLCIVRDNFINQKVIIGQSDFLLVALRFFSDPGIMGVLPSGALLLVALDDGLGSGIVDVEPLCDLDK